MTEDPLSVLFWSLAMTAGWRAIQDESTTLDWFWVGLWMGLGFLSKQVELLQLLSWAVLFVLWPAARKQLRRPGPYVVLLVNLVCTLPLVIWNIQHHWITARHVLEHGHLDQPWSPTPATLWHCFVEYVLTFIGIETALLNPFFFIAVVWAAISFWPKRREKPLLLYFFCMGAPLFLCCLLWSFHSRVLPNWIAPAILPLFCFAAVYWEKRWQQGARGIKTWLFSGLIVGGLGVVLMRDTNLITQLTGYRLPPPMDPTSRVRGWTETARMVEAARQKLLAEGKPVFIIGGHYGITAEVTFYDPEAHAGVPDHPLAYYQTAKLPENQFYFWPGYQDQNRKGQNAIYVQVLEFSSDKKEKPPETLQKEFESVTDLWPVFVLEDGRPIRRIQLMECRGLR
jgi:4-amino-4-deoxy-L-arabinose transferase-like glycosyltransferase